MNGRPKKFPQKRMSKEMGINPKANAVSHMGGIDWSVLHLILYSSLQPHKCLSNPTHCFAFFPHNLSHSHEGFRCLGDISHFRGLAEWWLWESVKGRGGGMPGSKQMTTERSVLLLRSADVQADLCVACDHRKILEASQQHGEICRLCWPSVLLNVV